MTYDVFICHSSKDRTIANAICSTLEQHHIRCWIAPRDVLPGSEYAGSIIEAINGSRLTVLVFSANSNESAHVRREIERTVSRGIPVLPFRVEEVVPSRALEYFISDAHWLDAMTPPLEQHLDHLVGTVRLLLERQAATVASVSDASPAAVSAAAASATRASAPAEPAVQPAAGAGAGGRPGASQTAALPSASPASTSLPGPTVAPGSAIAQITAALPTSLSCEPPETPSAESVEAASVFCYVGDGTVEYVTYTLYPKLSALRTDYGGWLDYYKVAMGTSGSCANGDRMEDVWSFQSTPSTTEGHYFCVVDDGKQANLFWTDEASLILVDLAGETGVTLDKLYPVWRKNTYDPVRP